METEFSYFNWNEATRNRITKCWSSSPKSDTRLYFFFSQFLGRQRKLKEGEGNEEKWVEIDETLHKLDQKLKDSGRPDQGTKKVSFMDIWMDIHEAQVELDALEIYSFIQFIDN